MVTLRAYFGQDTRILGNHQQAAFRLLVSSYQKIFDIFWHETAFSFYKIHNLFYEFIWFPWQCL